MARRLKRSQNFNVTTFPGSTVFIPDVLVAIVALSNYAKLNGGKYRVCILTILTPILMMLTPSKRAGLSKSSPCLLVNRQRCSYKVITFSFS